MGEVPRYMHHAPRFGRPADWELEAEAEFWRALSARGADADTIRWTAEIAANIEADLAARRQTRHKRSEAAYDLSGPVLDRVKRAADLLAIFGSRVPGTVQKAAGWSSERRVVLACPFHGDERPSLVVYVDQASWFCFQCNQGGDAITAVMLLDNLDFVPAVLALAREFGVDVPGRQRPGFRAAVEVPRLRVG